MRNFAYLMLFVAACNSDNSQINITKTVGQMGGTVSGSDGTSVVIPMGALSMSSNITITSIDAPAPAGTVLVGPAYDFGPDGTTFTSPVTITLPFDMSKVPAGSSANNIRIYTAARGSTNYTQLQTQLMSGSVSTSTNHFTVYLPAVPTTAVSDLGTVDLAGMRDLAGSSVCTPGCSVVAGSGGCGGGCSASCNGHTYTMSCSQGTTGPINCSCEIDSIAQSTAIMLSTCSDNEAQSAFQTQCLPN